MYSDLTLLSVNFNSEALINAMLLSISKYIKLDNILIVDNSNTKKLSNHICEKYNVFDNTHNHVTGDYGHNAASKNHCSTIDYVLKNLIKTKYVLLCDCDILFKPSIVALLEQYHDYDVMGEVGWDDAPPDRLFPYMCIIDVEKFNKEKRNYFDKNRCIEPNGIYNDRRGKSTKCWYHDTGSSFYEDIKDTWNFKFVNLNDYCIHLKGAINEHKKFNNWLIQNKDMWNEETNS